LSGACPHGVEWSGGWRVCIFTVFIVVGAILSPQKDITARPMRCDSLCDVTDYTFITLDGGSIKVQYLVIV
jgi:hypothetical protein